LGPLSYSVSEGQQRMNKGAAIGALLN